MLAHRFSILTGLWALTILILSFLPNEKLPEITFLWSPDKLVHFGVYAILAILFAFSISKQRSNSLQRYVLIIVICGIFGCLIEIFQPILTNRYFEIYDIVANLIGTIIGTLTSSWIYRKMEKAIL
jgi:VanZ family protein